jgi:hypothetical protein
MLCLSIWATPSRLTIFRWAIWVTTCIVLSVHNYAVLGFPLASGVKLSIGLLSLGMLANITLALDVTYNWIFSGVEGGGDGISGQQQSPFYRSFSARAQKSALSVRFVLMLILFLLVRSTFVTAVQRGTDVQPAEIYHHVFLFLVAVFSSFLFWLKNMGVI